MRTTVDLPSDVHDRVSALARDRRTSLSAVVAELVGKALDGGDRSSSIELHPETGWPLIRSGRIITTDDVRSLEDEW